MKTTMLNYEEVKGLLLQGYEVKLPEWQGYWKMNEKRDGIEVHTKDGEVLDTPQIMYTFHSNWEIATVDNCPILKKEKLGNSEKRNFEIIDITVVELPFIGVTPIVVVKMDGEEKPRILRLPEFEKLAGGRVEAMKMSMDFKLSKMPEELREMLSNLGMIDELNDMINLVEKFENEEVDMDEIEDDIEECDCAICGGFASDEDMAEFEELLGEIFGGTFKVKAVKAR